MGPGPPPTLFDLIMAGGLLGFCNIALLVFALPICAAAVAFARRRRTAILLPAILATLSFLIGATAVAWGYVIMNRRVQDVRAAGETVLQAEIDDAKFLIWFTAGQHGLICVLFLALLGLAVFLRRDREAPPE